MQQLHRSQSICMSPTAIAVLPQRCVDVTRSLLLTTSSAHQSLATTCAGRLLGASATTGHATCVCCVVGRPSWVAANSKMHSQKQHAHMRVMQSTWPQKQHEATESTCKLGTTRGCGHIAAMNGHCCTGLLCTHSRHAPHAAPLQHLDCCVRERAPLLKHELWVDL
jgi:hypothetical protein